MTFVFSNPGYESLGRSRSYKFPPVDLPDDASPRLSVVARLRSEVVNVAKSSANPGLNLASAFFASQIAGEENNGRASGFITTFRPKALLRNPRPSLNFSTSGSG